ncbi:DUF4350 domain-containing protein [Streptomyces sp. CAU 1734]|uniref:DUF4350 domain-containing protein n=1 Tax=Streptomyces sp. CAU 1734 TaxID=3140360 RepID=UPI00326072F7
MTAAISVSPTGRRVWKRTRGPLLALTVLIIAGVTIAALRSGDHHGSLDPRSADRLGSRAVAELLGERGVSTRVVTTLDEARAAAGPDTTLLVTGPDLLTTPQRETLRRTTAPAGGRTVLVGAGPASTRELVPGVRTRPSVPVSERAPDCALPAARRAGSADLGGMRYTSDAPGHDACYPGGGTATLLRLDTPRGGDTVLLGSPDLLYNDRLDNHGNASLALQLLGSRPHLVWYLPSLADGAVSGDDTERTLPELIPSGWLWGALQLSLAAVLAAIWRARRLGPLVEENLPVVIPASESTEGRARLYHQVNARDRAADVLRAATRTRIAPLLGIARADAHSPEILLPALAARPDRGGPDSGDRAALLFGPPPAKDADLVLLAGQLDALEREVRTS